MSDGTYTQAEWTMTAYIPYRDFAFTQMPLLPYVYGDVGLVARVDLLQRRVLSAMLSLVTFFVNVRLAKGDQSPIAVSRRPALYCA